MRSIHGNRDPLIDVLESIIHRFGIVVSGTALGSHSLMWASNAAILSTAEESYHLHVARLTGQLGVEIVVFKRMPLPGRPTVFVSLRAHPDADRALVLRELAGMRQLGTPRERGDLLEDPMPRALRAVLPEGFAVSAFPSRFHNETRDMAITGPDGRNFDVELRNHGRNTHDVVRPADRVALTTNHRAGRSTIFVIPRSTLRFRTVAAQWSGEAIDTNTYLVADPCLAQIANERGWSCWPAKTAEDGIPQITQQTATHIISKYPGMKLRQGAPLLRPADRLGVPTHRERVEIDRLLSAYGPSKHRQRVEEAIRLYGSGIQTQYEAAGILGISASALSKAFKGTGRVSPWRWGGPRHWDK